MISPEKITFQHFGSSREALHRDVLGPNAVSEVTINIVDTQDSAVTGFEEMGLCCLMQRQGGLACCFADLLRQRFIADRSGH